MLNFHHYDDQDYLDLFFKQKKRPSPQDIEDFLVATEKDESKPGAVRIAIPPREFKHYRKIQNLRKKYLPQFRKVWNKSKREIAEAYAEENNISIEKKFLRKGINLNDAYKNMLENFKNVADKSFRDGANSGNAYFEDMFKVPGLSKKKLNQMENEFSTVFDIKSKSLFQDQTENTLNKEPRFTLDSILGVLDTFDRFLLGYAGIAAGVAYDLFATAIQELNGNLQEVGEFGQRAFAVQWVLGDFSSLHSDDCLYMARGDFEIEGIGVWKAEELTATGITPGSFELDCGSRCHCHLRAITTDAMRRLRQPNGLIDNFTAPLAVSDIFKFKKNMSKSEFADLVVEKNWLIDEGYFDLITSHDNLLVREMWENIPSGVPGEPAGFRFNVFRADSISVDGLTNMVGTGKNAKPTSIDVNLHLPADKFNKNGTVKWNVLSRNKELLDEIAHVTAHELGHTLMFSIPDRFRNQFGGKEVFSTFLSDKQAKALLKLAEAEHAFAASKIDKKIKELLSDVSKISDGEARQIMMSLRDLFDDQDVSVNALYSSLYNGLRENTNFNIKIIDEVVSVPASDLLSAVNKTFKTLGIGDDLHSYYQLYNPDEYWAEWFGRFILNPNEASIMNNRMMKVVSEELKDFGEFSGGGTFIKAPNQVAINNLENVPNTNTINSIPPNITFEDIIFHGDINIKRLPGNPKVIDQVKEVFESFPNLLRDEFFNDGTEISFLTKIQMSSRTGSNKNISFWDTRTNELLINHDEWVSLSLTQRADLFSQIIPDNLEKKFTSIIREELDDIFDDSVEKLFNSLNSKFIRRGLTKVQDTTIEEFKSIVKNDDGGIDQIVWEQNFETVILPLVRNLTDLPINDIRALRNSESLFRDFIRSYITNPGLASQYDDGLYELMFRTLEA